MESVLHHVFASEHLPTSSITRHVKTADHVTVKCILEEMFVFYRKVCLQWQQIWKGWTEKCYVAAEKIHLPECMMTSVNVIAE